MKAISVDAFLGQLDLAIKSTSSQVAVAFDADGTLWSGDAGEDFLFALIDRKLVQSEAMEALEREALAYGVQSKGLSASLLVRSLFDAYVAGAYPEPHICRLTAWACAGYSEAMVRQMAHGILVDAKLPSRLVAETAEIVRFAEARGIPTYIVSASPEHVVTAGVKLLGLVHERVIAVEPHYAMGKMLPRVHEPIPYGQGKRSLLEAELKGRTLVAAFGDNVFDLPMLAAATFGVTVRPKERLLSALGPGEEESLWRLLPPEPTCD